VWISARETVWMSEGVRVDERTRAREIMMQQQQRDDEAKNSSCLLVLSLV